MFGNINRKELEKKENKLKEKNPGEMLNTNENEQMIVLSSQKVNKNLEKYAKENDVNLGSLENEIDNAKKENEKTNKLDDNGEISLDYLKNLSRKEKNIKSKSSLINLNNDKEDDNNILNGEISSINGLMQIKTQNELIQNAKNNHKNLNGQIRVNLDGSKDYGDNFLGQEENNHK